MCAIFALTWHARGELLCYMKQGVLVRGARGSSAGRLSATLDMHQGCFNPFMAGCTIQTHRSDMPSLIIAWHTHGFARE